MFQLILLITRDFVSGFKHLGKLTAQVISVKKYSFMNNLRNNAISRYSFYNAVTFQRILFEILHYTFKFN